jgi:hypothetical protein
VSLRIGLSLRYVLGRLSPAPKIPFLAAAWEVRSGSQRIFLYERGSFTKGKVKGPPERAFQCSLAKRAAVSLPLLANLLDAVGFAGRIE